MTRTVLLTLGRLPKALDIARAFHGAGWRVVVAEPFRWHLTGVSRCVAARFTVTAPVDDQAAYLRELVAIIERERVCLVVPVSEETMHVAFLRDRLPAGVSLFTMAPAAVLELHDKGRFIARAQAAGLRVPETYALGSAEATAMAAGSRVVVKEVFSCSGRGVRFFDAGAALPEAGGPDRVVQRFVGGAVHSNCAIARDGRVVANAIYRGAMMSGSVAVAFERVENAAIEAWIAAFVKAVGWSGFISFDFVVAPDGAVAAIECNPRATSGLHFMAPRTIAAAVISGTSDGRLRPERRLQQFYSVLTDSMSPWRFWRNLPKLLGTRDVTWQWNDPMPFLTMTFTSWRIIAMATAKRVPFGEVAMLDVEWRR